MNRAASLISIAMLAVSLSAGAKTDEEVIRGALHAVVGNQGSDQQTQSPPQPAPSQPTNNNNVSPTQYIAEQVVANGKTSKPRRDRRNDDSRYDPVYCGNDSGCLFGGDGAPTFDEVRFFYRNYPESELWNICMGRRSAPFAYGAQGACMMIGSPNPQRPVDLPHYLEHGEELSAEEFDLQAAVEKRPTCKESDTLKRKRPRKECVEKPKTSE